jgi:Right handed beta helix region
MSIVRVLVPGALLLVVATAAACYNDNPYYCEDRAYNNCGNPPGTFPCNEKADCAGQEGKLSCSELNDATGYGICVQCTASDAAACLGVTPVCGADHVCKGCGKHTDCSSAACLPDGSCGSDANVAYVAAAGTGTACTKAAPCGTLAAAVAKGKAYVKVAAGNPVKDAQVTTIDGKAVTILADEGAKLDRDGDGAVLEVRSAGADVKIYDLEITGATGASGANAIDVNPNGGAPKLTLTRVKLTGNQGLGLLALGGSVTISQSTISANTGGGISVSNATFDITNNFIVGNGSSDMVTGSDFGGLSLSAGAGANRLEQNTVAYNHAKAGTLLAAGVGCSVTNLVAPGNIVTSNNEGLTFPAQTKGVCTYGNSFIAPGSEANGLKFKSITTNPPDFHLTSESPTAVLDAGGACTGSDIDGDARPIGAACDLGADEFKP